MIAQGQLEAQSIVTAGERISSYEVATISA